VVCLIQKSDTDVLKLASQAIKNAIDQGRKTKGFTDAVLQNPRFSMPLRDGDKERVGRPEFAGCYFMTAKSKTRPQVVDVHRQPLTDERDIYSGCYGYVSVNFYPFSQQGNMGISAGLNNVMKAKDGEYLGGRSSAEADFAGVDFAADFGITAPPVGGATLQAVAPQQQQQQPPQTQAPLPWEDLPF
jgi:hypothetical protein